MKNLELKKNKTYGQELILDLFDCDYKILSSKKKILEYLDKICNLIKVKKYGQPVIKRFGGNAPWSTGYSFLQFIETSSISGHFLEPQRIVYINIFSCGQFNYRIARGFTKNFFKAKKIKENILIR